MKRVAIIAILFFLSPQLYSQVATAYSINTITVRSDINPRSVLFSNQFPDRTGYQSPLLGIALWQDSGRKYECRSILQFDLKQIPATVQRDPDLLDGAELILYPKPYPEDAIEPFVFSIQRVAQRWTDSLTTWDSQPLASSAGKIKIKVNPKRTRPIRIDVTKMVRSMLASGNFGFMFSVEDSLRVTVINEWFASAKNDHIAARPVLLIKYANAYLQNYTYDRFRERDMNSKTTSPATVTPPPQNRNNN